jgi:TPR repeat protein
MKVAVLTIGMFVIAGMGQGVKQDDAAALSWFNKAAALGEPVAQRNLGLMYYRGRSVEQSNSRAAEWLRKAADNGDEPARKAMEEMAGSGIISGT